MNLNLNPMGTVSIGITRLSRASFVVARPRATMASNHPQKVNTPVVFEIVGKGDVHSGVIAHRFKNLIHR